jgi:ABC-type sugar transport system ATPase subunit
MRTADRAAVAQPGTPAVPHDEQRVVLQARGITKSFSRGGWPARHSVEVLRGADLSLMAGEVVGLTGRTAAARAPS